MNDVENQVKDAFDALTMPAGLKYRTMSRIEEARSCEVSAKPKKRKLGRILSLQTSMSRVAAVLALVLVLSGGGVGGYFAYATETASVSISTVSQIVLGVNCFNRVVSVQIDEDAYDDETTAQIMSVRGSSYEEALSVLLQLDIIDESGEVVASVACQNASQKESLEQTNEQCLGNGGQGHGMGQGAGQGMGAGNGGHGHGNGTGGQGKGSK